MSIVIVAEIGINHNGDMDVLSNLLMLLQILGLIVSSFKNEI